MTRVQTQQALRQLPVKWALALLALIVIYALAQPALNNRLGWKLPSLARLMGEAEPKVKAHKESTAHAKDADEKQTKATSSKSKRKTSSALEDEDSSKASSAEQDAIAPEPSASTEETPRATQTTQATQAAKNAATKSAPKADAKKSSADQGDSGLLYGILKETGRDRYVSVEGLQYNPGSEEGHRLKHLERHLKDIPDRPGKHGVFDGQIEDALKCIDDAYARGKRGAKGVRKTQEEDRTIYEVPFTKPIGYIGGRDGQRDGNPPAKRLRLVVEGNKFITAFPF